MGQGALRIDGATTQLPPSYGRLAAITLRVLGGRHAFALSFLYHPPSTAGPYASLRVGTGTSGDRLLSATAPGTGWHALADLDDAGLALLLLALAVVCVAELGGPGCLFLFGLAGVGTLIIVAQAAFLQRGAAAVVLAGVVLVLARPRHAWLIAWFAVVYLCGVHLVHSAPSIGYVDYRTAGNDWLTYESQARSLLTGSLQGGENVFYYQPAWRYILFLERALFGDGDVLRTIFSFVSVNIAAIAAALWIGRNVSAVSKRLAMVVVIGLVLEVLNSGAVRTFLEASASESPTWALIPLLIAIPFVRPRSRWPWVLGPAAAALTIITRPNQALAGLVFLVVFILAAPAGRRRSLAIGLGLFVVVALLPSLHDAIYGNRFHLAITSGTTSQTLNIPPSRLIHFFSDASVRNELRVHAEEILDLTGPPGSWSFALSLFMHALLLCWLAAVVFAIRARRRFARGQVLATALPAAYLLPHLIYQVDTYFPRHIIAGYETMAFVAIGVMAALWSPSAAPQESQSQPTEARGDEGSHGADARRGVWRPARLLGDDGG